MQGTLREHQTTRGEIVGQQRQVMKWERKPEVDPRGLIPPGLYPGACPESEREPPMGARQVTNLTIMRHGFGWWQEKDKKTL